MRALWTALGIAAFVGLLALATIGGDQVECEVCVQAGGGSHCARAAASSPEEAMAGALRTACGTASSGMDDELACTNRAPLRVTCDP